MRGSCHRLAAISATALLRFKVPKTPEEEIEHFEKLRQEAEARGYGRRTSADDKLLMDKTFHDPEKIAGVRVANLPAKVKEETAFDKYERSTTEFSSIVAPHGTEKSALGAGFGARKDKRLGFLRPGQTVQPYSEGVTTVKPMFDENGMPVDETLSREEIIKKRREYLKSIEGTTLSPNEHFLLADLDFEKDAVLFGNTREEFERNVMKLKNVIVTYTKWERTDNFYYYTTILLKIMVLWVLIECLQQYYDLCLLEKNIDEFADVLVKEIEELDVKRHADFERARLQLQQDRPNFASTVAAIVAERDRVMQELSSEAEAAKQASASTAGAALQVSQLVQAVSADSAEDQLATPKADKSTAPHLSALSPPQSHPMDTMGDAAYTKRTEQEFQHREMKRLHNEASETKSYSLIQTLWHKIRGSAQTSLRPLQQDDFARYSYAASPTSIDSVRAVRRVLLPRSDDFTQTVREEMLAYKREKARQAEFPS